jgi:Tfp pilus assembly protein PilF
MLACASSPRDRAGDQLKEGLDREIIAMQLAERADRARVAGKAEEAIGLYRESLDYSARFPDVWNNLGLLLLEQNEFGKAINAFVQAGILDPADPRPPTNAGIAASRAGWEENAMKFYHDALSIQESYIPALRGAIRSADLLASAQYEDLDRVKRAMLAETDPQWRDYFKRQRFLIESRLRAADDRRHLPEE